MVYSNWMELLYGGCLVPMNLTPDTFHRFLWSFHCILGGSQKVWKWLVDRSSRLRSIAYYLYLSNLSNAPKVLPSPRPYNLVLKTPSDRVGTNEFVPRRRWRKKAVTVSEPWTKQKTGKPRQKQAWFSIARRSFEKIKPNICLVSVMAVVLHRSK